ncbi:MAG: tetratricopeptide repeat protein [Myxococcota bacterium]
MRTTPTGFGAPGHTPTGVCTIGICTIGVWLIGGLSACGGGAPQVGRQLAGERVVGNFVSPFSYEWFLRGELANARGDLEEAREAYTMARAGPEEDPLVLARLADVLDQLDRPDAADAVLAEGRHLAPTSEAVWMAAGEIAVRRGEEAEALEAFRHAAEGAPRSSAPVLAASALLERQGATGRAEATLEQWVHGRENDDPEVLRALLRLAILRGDADLASSTVSRLLTTAPVRIDEVIATAETCLDDDRPTLAVQLLSAVPRRAPRQLFLEALIQAGERERAEAILSRTPVEELGGEIARARFYLRVGRADHAAATLERLVLANEATPESETLRGMALIRAGDYANGAAILSRIAEGVRNQPDALAALAVALSAEGLSGAAREVLAHGTDPGSRWALALARAAQGDRRGALGLYRNDGSPLGRARFADLHDRLGLASRAAWLRVPVDSAELPRALRERARAERFAEAGDLARAVALLESVLSLNPLDAASRLRMAELLKDLGREEDAREEANLVHRLAGSTHLQQRAQRFTSSF